MNQPIILLDTIALIAVKEAWLKELGESAQLRLQQVSDWVVCP
jgi:hypothetical protein